MPVIILSNENWRTGKATLHQALPHVRSSHLAEAIAAGLGAQTHAAIAETLRSGGKHATIRFSADQEFVRRLEELGYSRTPVGMFDRAFSADRLTHAPYAFYQRGDHVANDRHYHHCEARGCPMVMVKMARRYAELEWDCITIDPREEGYLHGRAGDQLMRIMFNLFRARANGAPGRPIFFGSAFTGTVTKLLPSTARQLAEDYFRLLYSPLLERHEPQQHAA